MALNENGKLSSIKTPEKRVAGSEDCDSPKDESREFVIKQKTISQSGTTYALTSNDRVFQVIGYCNLSHEYEEVRQRANQYMENALTSIGDSIANYRLPEDVAKIHAKYAGHPLCPAIIGGYVLQSNGLIGRMASTSKKIKFS